MDNIYYYFKNQQLCILENFCVKSSFTGKQGVILSLKAFIMENINEINRVQKEVK